MTKGRENTAAFLQFLRKLERRLSDGSKHTWQGALKRLPRKCASTGKFLFYVEAADKPTEAFYSLLASFVRFAGPGEN